MMRRIVRALAVLAGFGAVLSAAPLSAQQEGGAVATEDVQVRYRPADEIRLPQIVDELAPETLLTVTAVDFEMGVTGRVEQCIYSSERTCGNRLPVRFDDRGAATFQYLVTAVAGAPADASGGCRLDAIRCTIELRTGDRVSIIETVFIDAVPPPGRLQVTPDEELEVGGVVRAEVDGLPPGTRGEITICAAPATSGPRCGDPAPAVAVEVGADGTTDAELLLDVSRVGADEVACSRLAGCQVVFTSDAIGVRVNPAPLAFAADHAVYDATRVALGIGTALVLLLVAGWLLRSSDWRPPDEADGRTIDDADFADLDAEADLFVSSSAP